MIKDETRAALQLASRALERASQAFSQYDLRNHLDTALRQLGVAVKTQGIHPAEAGITQEVLPVIIQLQLMSRMVELNTNPRAKR